MQMLIVNEKGNECIGGGGVSWSYTYLEDEHGVDEDEVQKDWTILNKVYVP